MSPERGGAGADGTSRWPAPDSQPSALPGSQPSAPPPAWPVRQLHPVPLAAHAPAPPAALRPGRRRRGWRLALAALLSAVLAVALGLLALDRHAERSSPESVARSYFQALADGDAPAALALAADPPRGQWLTSVVLGQQLRLAPLADISVRPASRLGSTATVEVRYRLLFGSGARSVSDTARLTRRGSSWWMSRVASTVRVTAGSPGADRLRLAGRKLPAAAVMLFPGALPLAADPPGLRVRDTGPASGAGDRLMVRLADAELLAKVAVSMSAALRAQVEQAVDRLLAGCLKGSNDPLCPLPGSDRPVPGSLRGSAPLIKTVTPRIALAAAQPGVVSVRARVPVQGSWQVWDFENQAVRRTGKVTVEVSARVALDRPAVARWDPP
ncbi:MAG TPA: hypothetical protein VF557_03625 [Jatrophihabitans sp.]|uniref:hypothetical protein n=1 Tax=Jatrophihabitans sp. TaxID=1932789 RepID=UPI002EE5EB5F